MAKFYTSEISEKYYEDYNKDCEIKRPLKVEEASNGVILPLKVINDYKTDEYHLGGVLYENREFCSLSSNKRKGTYYRSLQAGYEIEEKIKYTDIPNIMEMIADHKFDLIVNIPKTTKLG